MSDLLDISRAGRADREGIGLVVRVLGPTRVERDGDIAAIGGPRQRAVLARLVLADRQLVTADRLIEDVWGENAPRTAVAPSTATSPCCAGPSATPTSCAVTVPVT